MCFFFFFQAEDGIRDKLVTGVQTCALPISSYASDQAIFPIAQDRWFVGLATLAAFVVPPLAASEYWLQAVLIPLLIYSLAAIGLNLLTGYAGQLSLGTGGFMAVGAYAAVKLTNAFPSLHIIALFVLSALVPAGGGPVFWLPRPPGHGSSPSRPAPPGP